MAKPQSPWRFTTFNITRLYKLQRDRRKWVTKHAVGARPAHLCKTLKDLIISQSLVRSIQNTVGLVILSCVNVTKKMTWWIYFKWGLFEVNNRERTDVFWIAVFRLSLFFFSFLQRQFLGVRYFFRSTELRNNWAKESIRCRRIIR